MLRNEGLNDRYEKKRIGKAGDRAQNIFDLGIF
jgi:hypothetical protein